MNAALLALGVLCAYNAHGIFRSSGNDNGKDFLENLVTAIILNGLGYLFAWGACAIFLEAFG